MNIKIKYTEDIDKIEKITVGDWIDLRCAENIELKRGDFYLIPLGVCIKLPKGYEAYIAPRSSTFKNYGIVSPDYKDTLEMYGIIQTNYPYGIVDHTYCGDEDEWKFPALAVRDTVINKNDRICQFRLYKSMTSVDIEEVESMGDKSRGGFGSTGNE